MFFGKGWCFIEGEHMNKRIGIIVLSLLFVVNQLAGITSLHAYTANEVELYELEGQVLESEKIYVRDGKGGQEEGNGTAASPYRNLRTALDRISDGQTLVLVGDVSFTNYDVDIDGSAKPLFLNKNITITGDVPTSGLVVRTTIQPGADVTFKNMHLQLVPEIILGYGSNEKLLGTVVDKSTTIYAAGHTLVLDGVDTKVGTNLAQDSMRPYISGGAYKGSEGKIGTHATIKVINPIEQTRLSAIYAGDYWRDSNMTVDIELDARLEDTVIHTGGADDYVLEGDVNVTLGGKSNVTAFEQTNHIGNLNVTMKSGKFSNSLNLEGVKELKLENSARITVPKGGTFAVQNVILESKAIIDFRLMTDNPVVSGNFTGTDEKTSLESCGAVLIGNDKTLMVEGQVSGLTRLNTNGPEYIEYFVIGHEYVKASSTSKGDFTISGTQYIDCTLEKQQLENKTVWVIQKQESEIFKHLQWNGGNDTIVKPSLGEAFLYPIEFYNENGELYKPDWLALYNDFDITLVREDGLELDCDFEIFLDWDERVFDYDNDELHRVLLMFSKVDKEYGNLILTVSHCSSGVHIDRRITVLQKDEPAPPSASPTTSPSASPTVIPSASPTVPPSASPTAIPSVKPTVPPSASPTVIPSVKPTVKPSIKLNKTTATLYTKAKKTLQLVATVKGQSKKVTYTSSNSKVAKVSSSGKIVAVATGKATITARANGVTATCKITVKKPVLSVNRTKVTVKPGKTVKLTAKATPSSAIKFTSSNKKIATVTSKGVVKGIKKGTAKITVSCNGVSKKVQVTVK